MSDVDPAVMQSMSCEEVESLLPLLVDGEIDAETEPQLFAHLAHCRSCQESLAAYDLIDLALGDKPLVRSRPRTTVVYRLPWPVALAAGLLPVVAAWSLVRWWPVGRRGPSELAGNAAATESATEAAAPGRRIVNVVPPGPGHSQPIYFVREGDRILVVDPGFLDGGTTATTTGFGRHATVAMPEPPEDDADP